MDENELPSIVVDLCLRIHKELGPGLLESIYEAAIAHELDKIGIPHTRQQQFPVLYNNVSLGLGFRADLTVDNKLIREIKSVEMLDKAHHKTLLSYLKATGLKLGLLINFNVNPIKTGIHRKIMGDLLHN